MLFGQTITPNSPYFISNNKIKWEILNLTNVALDPSSQVLEMYIQEAQIYILNNNKQVLVTQLCRKNGPRSASINVYLPSIENIQIITKKGKVHVIGFYEVGQSQIQEQSEQKRHVNNYVAKKGQSKQSKKQKDSKDNKKDISSLALLLKQSQQNNEDDDDDDSYKQSSDEEDEQSDSDEEVEIEIETPKNPQRKSLRKKVKTEEQEQLNEPARKQFPIPERKPQFKK